MRDSEKWQTGISYFVYHIGASEKDNDVVCHVGLPGDVAGYATFGLF